MILYNPIPNLCQIHSFYLRSIIRLRENSDSSSNFYQKLKNSIYHQQRKNRSNRQSKWKMEKVVATINGSRTEVSKRGSNLVLELLTRRKKKERKTVKWKRMPRKIFSINGPPIWRFRSLVRRKLLLGGRREKEKGETYQESVGQFVSSGAAGEKTVTGGKERN